MTTDTTVHHPEAHEVTDAPHRSRRPWWTWLLVGVLALAAGVIAGLVLADDGGSEQADLPSGLRPVPAEVEAGIDALVDEWMMAWTEQDGEGVRDLFTDDFRYVDGTNPNTTLEGYDGDRLGDWIASPKASSYSATATDRVIVERVGVYYVAQKYQHQADFPYEYLELYTIVDDDGTLKFQYIESWAPLGWRQISDGQAYQAIENQTSGWPIDSDYAWED